jgi:hypothetical protein
MARDTREEMLQTYHDGELGLLARCRVRWRLLWSREERAALERMELLGQLLRDREADTATPPLWGGIASRLAVVDAELERSVADSADAGARVRWLGWVIGASAAVAAALLVAAVLWPGLRAGQASSLPVVQSLVTEGKPVMVLDEGEGDITIIWVIDAPLDEVSQRAGRAMG